MVVNRDRHQSGIITAICLALSIWLPGCATTDRGIGSGSFRPSTVDQVTDLAWPLFRASVEFCPFNAEPAYGFNLSSQGGGGKDGQPLTEVLVVSAVYSGLPANQVGLPVGSILLEMNEASVEHLQPESVMAQAKRAALARIEPLSLLVRKDGRLQQFHLESVPACHYQIVLLDTDTVNAYSDGRIITVTQGVLHFVANVHELAFVLAHEIAHNALQHPEIVKLDVALAGFLRAVGPESPADLAHARKDFEMAADRLALRIIAQAGYDVKAVPSLIERLGGMHATSRSNRYSETHPSARERLVSIEETIKEIQARQSSSGPTRPD